MAAAHRCPSRMTTAPTEPQRPPRRAGRGAGRQSFHPLTQQAGPAPGGGALRGADARTAEGVRLAPYPRASIVCTVGPNTPLEDLVEGGMRVMCVA